MTARGRRMTSLRIAVSAGLEEHAHGFPVLSEHEEEIYDVSIILIHERRGWMDRRHRRIHPHYVRDIKQALDTLNFYCGIDKHDVSRSD